MGDPSAVDLLGQPPVSHDAGVEDRELVVDGVRFALVTYSPGSGRAGWCDTPHSGFVLEGDLRYDFDDGREPLLLAAGAAFVLPSAPAHRGSNPGAAAARLFIIDALPEGAGS
jgi:hypothetical protein